MNHDPPANPLVLHRTDSCNRPVPSAPPAILGRR
jgi:hypothetical protein